MPDPIPVPPPDTRSTELVPRAQRGSVFLVASVEQPDKQVETRHRVRDLSTGGVRIDNAGGMQVGATVLVSIGAIRASPATIRWVRDGLAGLAFAEPIDPEQARKKAPAEAIPPRAPAPMATARPAPAAVAQPGAPFGTPPAASAGWIDNLWDPYRR